MADNDSDFDGSDEGNMMTQEQRDTLLLQAVKDNNYEQTEELLQKQANHTVEKDGWNPLLWAACNGNEEIVRLLLKHNAHTPYIKQDDQSQEKHSTDDGQKGDPFVKPKDAQKVGRYSPMHWASYKGHYKVVWILLKKDLSPLDIDMHGNTSVHQAASNEEGLKVLKCFLSQGCDIEIKNARGHTPLDLATTNETRQLITRAVQTLKCNGKNCNNSKFDFKNIRYYCESCTNFFCGKCANRTWVYEHKDSEEKERPICRCTTCKGKIEVSEQELTAAMETQEFSTVHKVLSGILSANLDIDVKLKHAAEVLHLKLEKELDIRNFIQSVEHVDNYKTILKSAKILLEKQSIAEGLGVQLDNELIEQINACHHRLVSERHLRFQMDNTNVMQSSHAQVGELGQLIQTAQEKNVEEIYLQQANKLSEQMNGNLKAREILSILTAYPEREYPEPDPVDAKGKPLKKDPKEKPKKKKKEPPFPMPDWAVELDAVQQKVKMLEGLAQNAADLQLEKEFLQHVDAQLKRFKKEIQFRKVQEEEARLEAEAKALAKKKAQKKK